MTNDWRSITWLGNSLDAWLATAFAITLTLLILRLIKAVLRHRLRHAHETESDFDDLFLDMVMRTRLLLLLFPIAHFWFRALELPEKIDSMTRAFAIIAALIQVGLWASSVADFWLNRYRRSKLDVDPAAVTTVTALSFMIKLALWSIIVLMGLDNLGLDITALVAGLGIGGVAVALATQNILGDLFASLSIVIDKPFVIGDFIIVGEQLGTVEYVGLKTTRLRSLSGEQIIFSNQDLLQSRIRNFKRMAERRVALAFGVTYQTSRAKIERIPPTIRAMIEAQPLTRFDRAHFKGFGDSSLDFEIVFYVLAPEYGIYMDTQETINLEIMKYFEAEGIEFAYPTRTIHVADGGTPGAVAANIS
ncbi:MAG TPA: mechanosensitive ion channel family protein [Thermoanaerobaculia bacterium]|nr:mechanosensitive ion channel family protein [Thermoanaerobaculia bacterium]